MAGGGDIIVPGSVLPESRWSKRDWAQHPYRNAPHGIALPTRKSAANREITLGGGAQIDGRMMRSRERVKMFTPREKAQFGIRLAQEAIVQFLNTQGNSALQTEIQDNLGLSSTTQTGNGGIVGALLTDLAGRNVVQTQGQGNQTRIQLLESGSKATGKGAASANR